MKRYVTVLIFCFLQLTAFTQTAPFEWSKVYGGSLSDKANSIVKTLDGGFITVGSSQSMNGDLSQNFGASDFWVVKLDVQGNMQWQKVLGGSGTDVATSVIQTSDGGFLVAGYTNSTDNNVSQFFGGFDYWIVKLNTTGAVQWQKSFGGPGDDKAFQVIQCSDNGFMIAGVTSSTTGQITNPNGMNDAWLVKTDVSGTLQWQESYGGSQNDEARSLIQLTDNSFVIACNTSSSDGDVTLSKGMEDVWIIKISPSGFILSQKCFGGSQIDRVSKIIQTKDGGYFFVGSTNSLDGDVAGNHNSTDFWTVKLSPLFTLFWQRSLGGSGIDEATSVVEAADSSLVVSGYTNSFDGDITYNHGLNDYWTLMLSKTGTLKWERAHGGSSIDECYSLTNTNDNNFVLAGFTKSVDGNILFNHGAEDVWLVKVKCLIADFISSGDTVCPNSTLFFTNKSANATNFSWKVNNVFASNQNDFSYFFTNSGSYKITLIASNAYCTDSVSKNIFIQPRPIANIGNDTTICVGTSVVLNTGADNTFDILWSTGATSPSINVSSAGMYWVNIMSTQTGCQNSDTLFVFNYPYFGISLGSDRAICQGNSTLLDPGFYSDASYLWSNNATTQTILASTPGAYSVTVTNSNGCKSIDTVYVTIKPSPTVNLGPDQQKCIGELVTLDAGFISGATYQWSGGQNTQTINATGTGNYSVTVTNSFGCTDRDTVSITFNPKPNVNLGPDQQKCTGELVTLDAGFISGATYQWSSGETTQLIDTYLTGIVFVEVTNTFGCKGTDTIVLSNFSNPEIITDSIKNISCYGMNNGAIYTSVTGGSFPFIYQWTGSTQTTDDIVGLNAGSFVLSVTDIHGCVDTAAFVINQPQTLVIDSIKVENASCIASNNGSIEIFYSGGTGPYTFSIDNGNTFYTTPIFTSLAQGSYSLVVKDFNNCMFSQSGVYIGVNTNHSVNLGNDTLICSGNSLVIDAGNPGASYFWSTLQTSQNISVSSTGTYSVTVTLNGCDAVDSILVQVNDAIIATIDSVFNPTCYGLANGAVYTSISGGTLPYNLVWTNTIQNTEDITNLVDGNYELTITDQYGCSSILNTTITEPLPLNVFHSPTHVLCYGDNNGSIAVNVSGGTSPYNFQWSSGVTSPVNLTVGIYSLTVTDIMGCEAFASDTILGPDELFITFPTINDAVVCGSATGAVYAMVTGGTLPYSYQWSGSGSTADNIVNVLPGSYSLTVTDSHGCISDAVANVYDIYCQTHISPGINLFSVCDMSVFYDMTPIFITEDADTSSGFIAGQNNATLILNAPAGFEFNVDSGFVYSGNGLNDIISASLNVSSTKITVTVSTGANHTKADTLVISGIEVKAIISPVASVENIYSDPASTLLINGTNDYTVYGRIKQSVEMAVTQITSFQSDSNLVVRGSWANEIVGIKINTVGNCGAPLKVCAFELNTDNSDNPGFNVPEAKIFYTGSNPNFAAINIQGTALYPDGDFDITLATPQELIEGDNYFWLAYNIGIDANLGDYLDGKFIKVIVDSNYYYPVFSPPDYKRKISELSDFISHGSGPWNYGITWGGNKAAWVPDADNNVTIINGDTITLTSNASCANLTITDGLLILGSYQLTISGNLTGAEKDSIRSTSSSSLIINDLGSKDQFPIPKAMKKLKKLTLNRAKGAYSDHDIDLDDAIPSDSIVLVLNNGALVMASGKKVLMNSKDIKKEISSSNSAYVDGIVSRNIRKNTEFYIYPLGNNGECRPFGVATQNGNGDNISEVQFFWTLPVNYNYVNSSFLPGGISDKMYWRHKITTGANTKRKIYYHDSDFPGLNAAERIAALCLANNSVATSTTEWTKETTPYTVNDNTGNKYVEFSSANASNDEYWTFGSTNKDIPLVENSLPIELLKFEALLQEEVVNIDWATTSEVNNDYFTIEKAGSDMVFSDLYIVNGAGNSYITILYHAVDPNPIQGVSYYRLKQTDFDGDYTYSDVRMVINNMNTPVLIYPNPARDEINIQLFASVEETVYVSLLDISGKLIYSFEYSISIGNSQYILDIKNLNACTYILRIDTKNNTFVPVRKMIVKM